MKKFLTYSVVVATIAWSMGISAVLPAAAAYTPTDGDLIKTATYPAVYYVMGGKKYLFVNRVTFGTWRDDFSGLKVVSQADFDSVSLGGNVTARPGVSLVKFDNSDNIYAVTPGAVLVKLENAAAKTALYGSAAPIIIQSSFEANYTKSAATLTASSLYPNGTLIKSGSATYLVLDGKLSMLTGDAYVANSLKAAYEHTVADISGYTTGAAITGKVSAMSDIVAGAGGPVSTGSASVSLSSDSPASNSIVAGQAIADLGHFTFTGTGTVTGLKVKRIGVSADETLTSIYLYDGNTKLTDAGSVSNGVISFNKAGGLFTINGSKVISVKSDILSTASGETVGVAINSAADVTGVTVSGSFPVNSNLMNIASATLAAGALGTAQTVNNVTAGTSNYTLWYNTVSVTTRAVNLKYIALKMVGSAPVDSFSNLKLYVNGTQVGTGTISSDGVLAFDLGTGVTLNTGSQSIEVRGDVMKGSSRTFKFSLQAASDIMLIDSSYNAGITVTGTLPSESASATISNGTISIVSDPTFTATQIVSNATNATLGKWTIKAYGEDMKFLSVRASTSYAGTAQATEKVNNLAIYVNGSQVGSTQTMTLLSGGYKTYGSGNLFVVPAGGTATVEIKGDLSLVSATTVTSITGVLNIVSGQVQGVASLDTSFTGGTYTATTMTVASGAVTLAKNAAYNDQTVSPNNTAVKVGSFVISNSDADTIRVTNINVMLSSSTLGYATNTSDLYISENTGNKVSPQSSNNFSVDFTIAPSGTRTIDVYMTIGNVTGTDLGNTLISSLDVTARTSANASAYGGADVKGQTITVNVGTLSSVTKTNDSMAAQYILGGTENVNLMVLNFKTNNAPIIIDELGFQLYGAAANGAIPITSITVNGVSKGVTTANTSNDAAAATTTLTGLNLTIPAGYAGKDVAVSANYNTVGLNALDSNELVSSSLVYIKYRGGSTTYTSYNNAYGATSSEMLLVATKPVVTLSAGSTLNTGTVRIARVTVTADAKGALQLKTLPLTFATTSANFTITDDSMSIKNANGDVLTTTEDLSADGTTGTITFTNGYTINAGSSAIFDVYAAGVTTSGTTAGSSIITTGLGAKASFTWDDIMGNADDITGTYYNNWPIDTVSSSK